MRSVVGPVEYHPEEYTDNGGTVPPSIDYDTPHSGIFHCMLDGGKRDVLLAHFGGYIWTHEGWRPGWTKLLGPAAFLVTVAYETELVEDDGRSNFPTQFVATPNGVVIIPQGGRAFFYDGTAIAPLGFDRAPGPPSPLGPRSAQTPDGTTDLEDLANNTGYAHSGRTNNDVMGDCRLGSIRNDVVSIEDAGAKSNALGGVLQKGEWRAAAQFLDQWGNLSPIGPQSSAVVIQKQDNLTKNRGKDEDERADRLRLQFAWTDIDQGPPHTIARQLLRTKDQLNSGIPGLFNVPPNATADSQVLATIPNNTQTYYPDNIPDTWLLQPAVDPDPVPIFRLAALAFGRLWIANTDGSPGLVRPSEPFFWGTFPKGMEIFPDANGGAVTGLVPVNQGLLVFTATSTFLITQDDTARNFRTSTLSTTVGCVAPNSAQVTQSGAAIWLGRDGFYGWSGEGAPRPISDDIKDTVLYRINLGWSSGAVAAVDPRMGEYRCWVPIDGSRTNDLCLVFDGNGWSERNDVAAAAVCVTKDHRKYMLTLGLEPLQSGTANSVWLLDHEGLGERDSTTVRKSFVETSWLRNTRSHRRASPMRAFLWLRETGNSTLSVQNMRDWRDFPRLNELGNDPPLRADEDLSLTWGVDLMDADRDDELRDVSAQLDSLRNHFQRRRPFWTKVDMNLPSIESLKVSMSSTGDWEFQAFMFDEQDRHAGGTKPTSGVE